VLAVHPHALRHACGFDAAERGVPIDIAQAWLGHRIIENTRRYYQTSAKRLELFDAD
jgi:integrase